MALIIGIGGVSRSGKTHLSHDIVWYYRQQNKRVISVRLDDYVKPINEIPHIQEEIDWEVPASIDYDLAIKSIHFFENEFDIVIVEGHLIYANEALARLIDLPFVLITSKATYLRRKAEDKRWGDVPAWYIDYIWNSFFKYGKQYAENPILVKADYPSIRDVATYLQPEALNQ